jgi:hypothetical protein
MVTAAPKTGREIKRKGEVTRIDHTYSGSLRVDILGGLLLKIAVIKFIAPSIEAAPDKCKLKSI